MEPRPDCVVLGRLGAVGVRHVGDGVVVGGALGVEGIVHGAGHKGRGVGVARVLPLRLGINVGLTIA